jgi:hypothetical protein
MLNISTNFWPEQAYISHYILVTILDDDVEDGLAKVIAWSIVVRTILEQQLDEVKHFIGGYDM